MSHYNQNSSNAWQNRANASNQQQNTFNSLQSHNDLISAAAAAVASSNLNHQQQQQHMGGGHNHNNNNNGGINTGPGIFSAPNSLLAQFAQANKVNFNNLAANLPGLVANSNVLQIQNAQPNNTNPNNYQWHSNRLNNNNNNNNLAPSQNGVHSNLINTNVVPSNGVGNRSGYNNNGMNNNNNKSSTYPSLMDNNSKNQQQNAKSSSNRTNSSSSNVNGRANNSNNNNNNNNNGNNNNSGNVTGLALSNPIAQALLNQLASSGGNQANTAIVAAALALSQQNNNNNSSSLLPPPTSSNIRNVIAKSSSSNNNNNNNSDRRSTSNSQRRSRSPVSSSRNNRNNSTDKNVSTNSSSGDRRSISISKTSDRITITSSNSSSINNRSTSKRRTKSRSPPNYSSASSSSVSKPKPATTSSSTNSGTTGTSTTTSSYAKNSSTSYSSSGGGGSSSSSSKRYSIRVPKYSLDYATDNVTGLKNRYSELYIPSDFTNSKNTWVNSLPLNRPLKFTSRCLFHIMNKEAHSIEVNNAIFDAPDSDHTWTVKVMLLAMPNVNELVKRSCSLAEDNFKDDRFEHPSKVIQFLVGNKGKHELMALGGAWSKSLDGPDPATNTQTLVNTATRTVKALTGIDLTACTQWFRFLDIQYNRNEDVKTVELNESLVHTPTPTAITTAVETETPAPDDTDANDAYSAGITNPTSSQASVAYKAALDLNDDSDIETTVIFVPNIWSLMPNSIEYQQIVEAYKNFIENPPIEEEKVEGELIEGDQKMDTEQENMKEEANDGGNVDADNQIDPPGDEALVKKEESIADDELTSQDNPNQDSEASKPLKVDNESSDNPDDPLTINSLMQSANDEIKTEPTHYSKLDVKKMKVDELRNELEARGMDTKGLKAQLSVRLTKAIQKEKEADGLDHQSSESKEAHNQSLDANESTSSNNINNSSNLNYDENDENFMQMDAIDLEKQNELSLNPSEDESDRRDVVGESIKQAVNTVEAAAETLISSNTNGVDPIAKTSSQKTNEPPKPKKPKLTRADLERLYKLPEAPHIVVHPSKTAKSGKFECKMVSLSHLLSYHKEDNKESSFEVSLFAEYFNEMLVRDFGFAIYKHIISVKEDITASSTATSAATKRKLSVSNENSADATDSDVKKSKTTTEETETKDTIQAMPKTEAVPTSVPSTKISLAMIKTKAKTIFPEILLAFTYFDLNRTNYVYEKDLEDLLLCIGLSLSRSKIRSILKKFKFKDSLMNYRSLTDKVVPISTPVASIRQSLIYYKVPSDDEIVGLTVNYDSFINRLIKSEYGECGGENRNGVSANSTNNNAVVELNGITIDVMNTVKKLENSELYALTLDQKLKESLDEIERLKIINRNAERQKLKLTDETNDCKKRLREQQRVNKETNDKYIKYKDFINKSFKSHVRELYDDYEDLLGRDKSHSSSQKTNSTSTNNTKSSDGSTVGNDTTNKNSTEVNKTVEANKNLSNQMSNVENATNTSTEPAENGDDHESENVENEETNGIESVAETNKEEETTA